jgi:hypothetical protein
MQFEITDEAAITFSHEFYAALADGYPIDAAVAEARKMIYAQANQLEWATPVLYTSIDETYLLPTATGTPTLKRKMQEEGEASISPINQDRIVKLRVHRAYFTGNPQEYYFVNVTNLSANRSVEVTHVWYQDTIHHIPVHQTSRPLPVRLKPDQSWETFIAIHTLPELFRENAHNFFRTRLSTGDVVRSERNVNVPPIGVVPGGQVQLP